ncbi:hypothetical protein HW561_12225 [Rhodobacteraceae bacterium B1Z28]|uniref:Uncharacterized protein n=1 Tax=Ruegeria haliotis TaxID=2747601 RepID=A0ABX2PS87_9RHOB|nr:hypothetical protein [Ruegeria haliotis]NVO56555.1 hypothetical protein [Ruegeria haliotis]
MLPAKAISAVFCRLRAFPERIARSGVSLWAICFLSTASLATAQAPEQGEKAVFVALELCSEPIETLVAARAALAEAGWTEFDEGPGRIVLSNRIAFSIDEADLPYTIRDASFMTASLLGNSALGPNQLAFEHSNVRLALIGIEEGQSSCAFTGPAWLLQSARTNGIDKGFGAKTRLVTLNLSRNPKVMAATASLEVDAFIEAYSAAETDQTKREEMVAALPGLLMPTNIFVAPFPQDAAEGAK